MKPYLLALSLLLAGTSAYAQPVTPPLTPPVDPETHQITYSRIITVPGATKSELYARGKIWFGTAFYSAQHVVLADDQPAGFIVGRGFSATTITYELLSSPFYAHVWCTIKLSFQEGRYRYILTDFYLAQEPTRRSRRPPGSVEQLCLAKRNNGKPTHQAIKFSQGLDRVAQRLVSSLEPGMSNAAGGGEW